MLGTRSLSLAARQAEALADTAHRPWPLPPGDWLLGQTWEHLLFAHWRVPESELRALVPTALEIDRYDGDAWLGITPFRLTGLRARGMPPAPIVSRFPELNVRTYVTAGERPGIYFFSLDAASRLAVAAARRAYKLPYFRAQMSLRVRGRRVSFESVRAAPEAHRRVFRARYRPEGPAAEPRPGTLEYFLTERYCLYAVEGDRLYRAEIHHPPWRIAPGLGELEENTMVPAPVQLSPDGPLLHVAEPQDALIWPLRRLDVAP
jgi:uncharacterized protein YqjF (DUF2071 family)